MINNILRMAAYVILWVISMATAGFFVWGFMSVLSGLATLGHTFSPAEIASVAMRYYDSAAAILPVAVFFTMLFVAVSLDCRAVLGEFAAKRMPWFKYLEMPSIWNNYKKHKVWLKKGDEKWSA